MRLRVSLELYSVALLSALGLGCGGNAESSDNPASGGNGGGTTTNSGGAVSTGGALATGGGVGVGGSTSTQNRFPCLNPTPVLGADGQPSGYVQCDGFVHRAEVRACASGLPRMTSCPYAGGCVNDTECTERPLGHCTSGEISLAELGCHCQYGCATDTDCPMGQICLCGETVGRCVQASCSSDADCPGQALCKSYVLNPGCGGTGFACQTPADECGGNQDCLAGRLCSLDASGRHWCAGMECVAGRPFLVSGLERLAPAATRTDWKGDLLPCLDGLSAPERTLLADHWKRVGLMEHASIAAFARFALELLALGAPVDLVEATGQALREETEHARACFALASRYAEKPVGPGRLEVHDALVDVTLERVVMTALEEGCIGETIASVEAAEAAEHAKDPVVRSLLQRIAQEETRHAVLAWRFLSWALEQADAALRSRVARRFEHLTNVAPASPREPSRMLRHGLVSADERAAIKQRVLAEIVRPCAAAVLGARNSTERIHSAASSALC